MAQDAHLRDTHHFDVRRGRRGVRYDVALAAACEGTTNDGARYCISRRRAAQLEAELRAQARLLEREGVRCLSLVNNLEADEGDRRALARCRELLLAMTAELRRQADAICAASRGVTSVVRGNNLVTTYRNAA